MNTLSKTQVIALFLGATSAQTVLDSLSGITVADTVPTDQVLWTANAGGSCNSLGGCDAESNKCANLELVGADTVTTCVYEDFCGSYGRVANAAFGVNCWTAVAEGETPTQPDAIADPAQFLADIEGLITSTIVNWDAYQDMIVSPRYNYQDGYFVKITLDNASGLGAEDEDVGKWMEIDKPADNRCFLDLQCPSDSCCGFWPDSNNRRCMLRTLDKVSQTVGPVTFSPTCLKPDENVVPENAQDDISAGALAEANEELDSWRNNLLADAKEAAGYDTDACDADCKAKFDKDADAAAAKAAEFIGELKALVEYDDVAKCDDACKAVFEANVLKWEKEVYQTCKDDAKGIACREANAVYKDTVTAQGNAYYTGEASDRESFDGSRAEAVEALESSLAAAWLEANDPAAGTEGGECAADGDSCTNPDEMDAEGNPIELCCGTMTHKTNKGSDGKATFLVNKCANKKSKVFEDSIGGQYTHVCGAFKIGASLAAAVVASLYM